MVTTIIFVGFGIVSNCIVVVAANSSGRKIMIAGIKLVLLITHSFKVVCLHFYPEEI